MHSVGFQAGCATGAEACGACVQRPGAVQGIAPPRIPTAGPETGPRIE